ncbi:MAG: hypothetical protein FWE84_00805 [Firmicutes bacterium]|nr:hypothetical protein [Bacillota bacterium]
MSKGFMANKVKKFVCLGIACVMLSSLVGLSGCGVSDLKSQIEELRDLMQEQEERIEELEGENEALRASELALYKRVAKYELEAYARNKGEDNYCTEEWEVIMEIVAEGKTEIDAAEDKAGVDGAVTEAREAIDEVMTIIEHFDLTDPKEIWDGSFEDGLFEFLIPGTEDAAIFIFFKQIKEGAWYPQLEVRHLGLAGIRSFEYCSQSKPQDFPDDLAFRQTAFLFLTESNPETFTSAIRHLERLDFVRSATPANVIHLGEW